ncbi:MAG: glycoside hydrolase family 15 protein [Bacteroidales bacterium]|nr:glycoside hydrolase family 15 protein [Bacteroidales bacterium]
MNNRLLTNLDYGVIGNGKSAALVSRFGSIDWCCLPGFNSSSVFAAILDQEKGGHFGISVNENYNITQRYQNNTNLLVTRFEGAEGIFEFIDLMPRYITDDHKHHTPPDIIRYVKHIGGNPTFRVNYKPRLEYALHKTVTVAKPEFIKSYTSRGDYDSLYLYTSLDKQKVIDNHEFTLSKDEFFLVSYNQKILDQTIDRVYLKMEQTKVYWLNWSDKSTKFRKYNEEILRSALILKMLSFDKSGAILAAITTSLPETIGEVRNWDYRFCWIRDASMVIRVMTFLGHQNIARRYLKFIIDIIPDKDEKIQIMYGINGEKTLTERTLNHLSGYENSKPVRVGNAAYKQKQNDIYGVLMDVFYQQFLLLDTSLEESEYLWTITRSVVKMVEKNWQKPDRGIWELRTEQKHFTFSKMLCWVAVDRAIKIADLINKQSYAPDWIKLRDNIKADIHKNAWNEKIGAFTQVYGGTDLDASNLLLESYGFIAASDPKFVKTVEATQAKLSHMGLMYRYKNQDDFGLPKSSFTICSFWLVNALFKIGRKKEAVIMFNQLLSYSNHLGIFSEDIDFETKRLLGNFPQAYSHLALIETAINISEGLVTDDEQILEMLQ